MFILQRYNFNTKMWQDCPQAIRSNRVAMAGSIYMRRASLEAQKQGDNIMRASMFRQRIQSVGKIIKNNQRKDYQLPKADDTQNFSFQNSRLYAQESSCLLDRKTIPFSTQLSQEYPKRSTLSLLNKIDEPENIKIKVIQDKYRKMLSLYEDKKKAIDTQLLELKNGKNKQNNAIISKNLAKNQSTPSGIRSNNRQPVAKQNNFEPSTEKARPSSSQVFNQTPKIKVSAYQYHGKATAQKQKIGEKHSQFFKLLHKQINLEEQLRNTKLQVGSNHRTEVMRILSEKYQICSQDFLLVSQEEQDPFLKQNSSQNCPEILAQKLSQLQKSCSENWDKLCNIQGKEARQIFSALNFEKNREISLKAFVRQVGLILQKHFRNRDLFKIYKRLEPLTEHNFCAQLCASNEDSR